MKRYELQKPSCFEHCPVASQCETAGNIADGLRKSIATREGNLDEIQESMDRRTLFGAYAVLSGEVTADQSEKIENDMNGIYINNFGMSPNELMQSQRNSVADAKKRLEPMEETVRKTIPEVKHIQETCGGPRINLKGKIAELMIKASIMKLELFSLGTTSTIKHHRKEILEERLESQRETNIYNNLTCSQPKARKLGKKIVKVFRLNKII